MGKTDGIICNDGGAGRSGMKKEDVEFLRKGMRTIRYWESRLPGGGGLGSITDNVRAQARALKKLAYDPEAQKDLIRIAQSSKALIGRMNDDGPDNAGIIQAQRIGERARSLIMLCHNPVVESEVMKRIGLMKGEMTSDARDVLRQEAFAGINRGIDSYDFESEATPLTYFRQGQIRNFLKKAVEREGQEFGVRLKGEKTELAKEIDSYIKSVKSIEDRKPSLTEISDQLGLAPETIAEVLPFVSTPVVRMDAPVKENDYTASIGEMMEDVSPRVDDIAVQNDVRDRVRSAVKSINSPLIRRTMEMVYGLDCDPVKQRDLSEGVYKDKDGNLFSSERSIISKRKANNEDVEYVSQTVLNQQFEDDELVFVPGTPEAYELALVGKDNFDASHKFEREITKEMGMPLTPGKVFIMRTKAEEILRADPRLQGIAGVYRGGNEIENSGSAREKIRHELKRRGVLQSVDSREAKAASSASGGKSKLRLLAEQENLLDEDGRVIREAISI